MSSEQDFHIGLGSIPLLNPKATTNIIEYGKSGNGSSEQGFLLLFEQLIIGKLI